MMIVPRQSILIMGTRNTDISSEIEGQGYKDIFTDSTDADKFFEVFEDRWQDYEVTKYYDYEMEYIKKTVNGVTFDADQLARNILDDWFEQAVTPVLYMNIDYYNQRLKVYKAMYPDLKDIDVESKLRTLLKTTTTTGNKGMVSDLPNKQINEEAWYDYPSTTSKTDATTETDDSTMLLSMYRAYLGGLRNIYLEFAEKFSDCFMHTFSGGEMEWYTRLS